MKKEDEPDFYALDKTNPLPALEDAPVPGAIAASIALQGQQHAQMHGQSLSPQQTDTSCSSKPHHSMHQVVTPPHPHCAMEPVPQRRGPPPRMYPNMYPPGHVPPQEEYEYEMPFQPALSSHPGHPRHGMSYPEISPSNVYGNPMPAHQMHGTPMDGQSKYGPPGSPQAYRPMEHSMYPDGGADSERRPPTQEEYFHWQQQQIKRMQQMQRMPADYPEQRQQQMDPNQEDWMQHRS